MKFKETIVIDRSPEVIFDYTQDYTRRLHWDTFLKKADLLDGALHAGKGVRAYCLAKNGIGMATEYITYNRPKVTAVKMTSGPWMFKTFMGSWTFKDLYNGQTEVIFVYSFSMRFPFSIATRLMRRILISNIRQRLADLKQCVESD